MSKSRLPGQVANVSLWLVGGHIVNRMKFLEPSISGRSLVPWSVGALHKAGGLRSELGIAGFR